MCNSKFKGGMGFRSFQAFNHAFLVKQTWCILKNEDSLMARYLRAKYFPRKPTSKAQKGYRPSSPGEVSMRLHR